MYKKNSDNMWNEDDGSWKGDNGKQGTEDGEEYYNNKFVQA
jgi:hypothetical protein